MKFNKFATISATALLLGTSSLAQTSDPVLDDIVADLAAEGYSRIEVKRSPSGYKIEATGAPGKIEQVYDAEGNLKSEEIEADGQEIEREYDAEGNITKEEIEPLDDEDDEDDDDEDDEDDDEDDEDDEDDDEDDDDEDDDEDDEDDDEDDDE